jgi:hypothetical protein
MPTADVVGLSRGHRGTDAATVSYVIGKDGHEVLRCDGVDRSVSVLRLGLGEGRLTGVASWGQDGRILYAGIEGGGIRKSTDGGATWFEVNAGLMNRSVNCVAVSPSDSDVVFAGMVAGDGREPVLWESFDGGTLWQPNESFDEIRLTVTEIRFHRMDNLIVYVKAKAEEPGLELECVSWNGGRSWTRRIR